MRMPVRLLQAVLLILAGGAMLPAVPAQTNHPWEIIEMTFEARGEYANPYVDGLPDGKLAVARATFTGISGPAQGMRHTLALFWDGARTWKARFAPPAAGEWNWSAASNDPGLDGATGKFQVVDWTEPEKQANPARRGFIRVHQKFNGKPKNKANVWRRHTSTCWFQIQALPI